ncbi:SPOR domain-containing protein [Marivita geojedonensis]|uniref:Sporulation domain-containing protein n=1 Tax=Marivita geojedonensis TaxID=1123756 RepID=A0A1X4NMW3_9RHOB|nr:SPOR domain-containing protein [Marivita geojedonensis]OSQ51721.1 sporulation domain-containing protein [Marivita geojedonensis]PRY79272.1 sporulation related protein [Marivita geojedonensis]
MDIRITNSSLWRSLRPALVSGVALLALAGCEGASLPAFLQGGGASTSEDGAPAAGTRATRLVERDVEAPEVFQVTENGLWDGRPSLGGVWAAHPDVSEPERVIIRNETNGNFVIGALFRKERETPGPRLQISSDAAAALGVLAGAPTQLNVVALRREEVPDDATAAPVQDAPTGDGTLDAPAAVAETTLDPIAESAAAALDATPAPTPAAAPKPTASSLDKPFIQIGIFSIEQNANNTATAMRQAGMVPTVLEQSSSGKTFWRVLVGPAQTRAERSALLAKIKDSGFTDAYAVTN